MGHKFYIGVGLLLALLAGSLGVSFGINNVQKPVSQYVQQAIEQAESGDLQSAAHSIGQAKERWRTYRNMLASFSDHDPMDDIDELLAQVQAYADAGSTDHFLAGCGRLSQLLESLGQDHKLTWWNLLTVAYSRLSAS